MNYNKEAKSLSFWRGSEVSQGRVVEVLRVLGFRGFGAPRPGCHLFRNFYSERVNFKLFGLIYYLHLRKFELFGARLLKKRGNGRR